MGAVSSCLAGLCGSRDDVDRGETSRLLRDDGDRAGYGSHGAGTLSASQRPANAYQQPDSEVLRREREALESICHSMSDNIEDLFTAKATVNAKNAALENVSRPQTPELQVTTNDMAMRTIKKGKAGPIYNTLGKRPEGWRAVQDAIG